jgi:hypothetical protein
MRVTEVILESNRANFVTARQIAQEIHQNVSDLTEIIRSGSTTAAGNPHYVQGLKQDIMNLHQELMGLGYEYDSNSSDHMRPLTLGEASRAQQRAQKQQRREAELAKQRAEQAKQAELQRVRDAANRALRRASVTRKLDPERQFTPPPQEPEAYTFGGVSIPVEKSEPEPTSGHYVLFRIDYGTNVPTLWAYWIRGNDFDVQMLDGTRGWDSARKLRQSEIIKSAGQMANTLERLRKQGSIHVIFDRAVRQAYPDFAKKMAFYIDNNMDDFVGHESTR